MQKFDQRKIQERINPNKLNIMAIKREPLIPISIINLPIHNQCSNHAARATMFKTNNPQKELVQARNKAQSSIKISNQAVQKIDSWDLGHSFDPSKIQTKRRQEIQKFLNEIKQIKKNLKQRRQSIIQKLIDSEQFYGQQLQQVNQYFTLIIKALELQKHKCYNEILNQRSKAQQYIRNINQDLGNIDRDISKIICDIEDNLETVFSIQQEMYHLVLQQYRDQKQYFHQNISGFLLAPIQLKKILFKKFPDSICQPLQIRDFTNTTRTQDPINPIADSVKLQNFEYLKAISPRIDRLQTPQQKFNNTIENTNLSFEGEKLRSSILNQIGLNQQSNTYKALNNQFRYT